MKKFFLFLILTIFGFCFWGCKEEKQLELTSYQKHLKILNEEVNSDIIILGDTTYIDSALNYRTIDKITEKNLQTDKDYGYQALIINDLADDIEIDDNDFEVIKKFIVDEDKDVIYLGRQYLKKLSEWLEIAQVTEPYDGIGIFGCFPDDKSEYGVGVCLGIWTTDDTKVYKESALYLSEVLLINLADNATGESYAHLD